MHAAMIEAVPAGALAALAEAAEERLAPLGIEHVVLTRNEEHGKPGRFQHLLGIVELVVARELRHVARVDDEVRLLRQRLHLGDRFAKGGAGVGVGRLVEADVTVAHLDEGERRRGRVAGRSGKRRVEPDRAADPAVEGEQRAGSGPGHALQEAAAVAVHLVEHPRSFRQALGCDDWPAMRFIPG